jgi:hypothetical protein
MLVSYAAGSRSLSTSFTPQFTYTLGNYNKNSLYVPLTSYCNSATLPQTRGPNFLVSADVVASLCRLRDAEFATEKWKHWCTWLDYQETPQKLPAPAESSCVCVLDEVEGRRPTVDELVAEVETHLKKKQKKASTDVDWTIVVAGEGEPTLRLNALIELVERLYAVVPQFTSGSSIRITTNGLLDPGSTERLVNACSVKNNKEVIPITFSVALMTHDADQYDQLMQPALSDTTVRGHDLVQNFIRSVVAADLEVETTAVDRPDIDKERTNQLSVSLGVAHPVRWRIYFQ